MSGNQPPTVLKNSYSRGKSVLLTELIYPGWSNEKIMDYFSGQHLNRTRRT